MEPAATGTPAAPGGARRRAGSATAFPALARKVHGHPLAYLDSGASAQRVLASIQAVDRYERRHHSNVHRGSHTLSAEATAAYEGARATVADHLGAADRREVVFVRNATEAINLVARAWGIRQRRRGRPHPADGDGAPLQHRPLAAAGGGSPGPRSTGRRSATTACSTWTPSQRCSSGGRSWSRSPTSPTSSGPRTRSPRSPASPTTPGRWSSSTAPRPHRSCRSTSPRWGSTSTRSPATSSTGRPGSARSGRGSSCCDAMPPFLGGGSMIRKVTKEGTTYADPPARFEAGTPAIAQAIGMAAALRWLDGLGMDAVLAHEREIADYALESVADGPGPARLRPAPLGRARSARSPSRSRASTPTTSPRSSTATGSPMRAGHHCAQPLMDRLGVAATTRASFAVHTTRGGDRPPGRGPARRPPRLQALSPLARVHLPLTMRGK